MCNIKYSNCFLVLACIAAFSTGCKKLVEIDAPKSTITTGELFADNAQAEWAVAAIYSKMIYGASSTAMPQTAITNFGAGLSTVLGSLSSDEMRYAGLASDVNFYLLNTNKLITPRAGLPANAWTSAYKTIYDANAVIDGLAATKPGVLLDSIKNQLTGEAMTLRSFAYFYLVNFFGDVPLALTIDYSANIGLSRAPVARVYEQLIDDLTKARSLLAADFSVGKGERVRVNKWFAEALLARVYLYAGRYQDAVNSATAVINKADYFSLEQDLARVFSSDSKEAIMQLKGNNTEPVIRNGTAEGYLFLPANIALGAMFRFTNEFIQSFAINDQRKSRWMLETAGDYVPYKYTIGQANGAAYGPQPQYYMVMRLAELYLIRAEAGLLLSEGNKNNAIADLNALRPRTGLDNLPNTLTAAEVKAAIANERRFELFAEWGHRWLDLKRTGTATTILSQITAKQPWAGDHQLLYPIPATEIKNNRFIIQNPQYDTE